MKHLGDITKISGYTAPIVDCIIGGSPCQDLSVAGKRAGLDGERSGLYIEQVRIVKEMRERDERNGRTGVDIRPRYMVWENVPGAFSSNKSEDFRIVLEELAKVKDKDAVIPRPADGKWRTSGCIMGDGWSIAWRVLDTQFWGLSHYLDDGSILILGTPQRRKRIALVADFGGQSAQEILFVRKSVSRHTDESKPQRKETPSDATGGIGVHDRERGQAYHNGRSGGDLGILQEVGRDYIGGGVIAFEPGIASREGGHIYEGVSGTLRANAGDNQMATAYTVKIRGGCEGGGKGALVQTDKSATLSTLQDQILFQPVKTFSKSRRAHTETDNETWVESETANTLNIFDVGDTRTSEAVVYALDRASFNQGKNAQYDFEISDKGINSPLVAKGPGAVCYGINGDKAGTLDASYYKGCGMRSGVERDIVAVDCRNGTEDAVNGALQSNSAHSLNGNNVVRTRYIVRRLTPLECERLQGYPDGWTDIGEWVDTNGKKRQTSDAARYKALGNSIALPPWKWVLKRLCACYERDATMASLFDGIGGFPYLWEQLNGKGTCLWASEIEEFPIAVTKVRIGGNT